MICTQPYTLDRFNFVAVPQRYRDEWHALCFGYAKKSYSRFAELERLLSISAAECGGIRLEPINNDAFVDGSNVTWQRLAYSVIFGVNVLEELAGVITSINPSDIVYVLCETAGDGLNLYSGSRIKSCNLNGDGETVLTFVPKLSRIDITQRVYRFEEAE